MKVIGRFNASERVEFDEIKIPINKFARYHVLEHWIKLHGYKTIVEIGTFEGETAAYLLANCPGIKLFCVDPYAVYHEFNENQLRNIQATATERVFKKFPNVEHLHCESVAGAAKFEPGSIDLVFIDGNHLYPGVMADLEAWYPKVKAGGMFTGHDYATGHKWVIKAVDEFCQKMKITNLQSCEARMWFVNK